MFLNPLRFFSLHFTSLVDYLFQQKIVDIVAEICLLETQTATECNAEIQYYFQLLSILNLFQILEYLLLAQEKYWHDSRIIL